MSLEKSYIDMEIYLNYSILISNDLPMLIIGICDNLIDCNKLLYNNDIAYMYRIPVENLESGNNIIYKKIKNNNDYIIPKNIDGSNETMYYIIYEIKNKEVYPLKITKNLIDANKYIKLNTNLNVYIAGIKSNKIYNSIYEYEYLSINVN